MLAVLYMLIVWARDADTWRWLGQRSPASRPRGRPAGQAAGATAARHLPPATGPTDEDPDQAETAREEFQALTDGTLDLGPRGDGGLRPAGRMGEEPVVARLYAAGEEGLRYTDLHDDAEKHRGELVALDVESALANDAGKNRYGVPLLRRLGGHRRIGGAGLYSLIVVDFPKGMPLRAISFARRPSFAGYFLKLQGYEPGSAKPGQAPEKAPLLIGRLAWEPAAVAAPPMDNTQEWIVGLGPAGGARSRCSALHWGYAKWFRRRPAARPLMSDAASGEVIPIEAWLERSSFELTTRADRRTATKMSPAAQRQRRRASRQRQRADAVFGRLDGEDGKG